MADNEEKIGVIIENLEEILTRGKAYIFDKEGGFIGSDSHVLFVSKIEKTKYKANI